MNTRSVGILFLLFRPIFGNHNRVVSLVWLQSQLLERFEIFILQFAHFPTKDRFRRRRTVNATGLDGNDRVSPIFQKVMGIERDDARLIGLRHIGKDDINHADEHAVFEGVPGVFNDWNDVGALLGNAEEVASRTMREFDSVDGAAGTNNVADMGNGGASGSSKVKNLGAWFDPNIVNTTEDSGSDCNSSHNMVWDETLREI